MPLSAPRPTLSEAAIMAGAVPLELVGLVKSAIAAVIVAGGWQALRRRRG